VDDGSTDSTSTIIKDFDFTASSIDSLKVISQENRGESASINKGLASAKGDYVVFLSHDDILFREHLYELVPILEASPELIAVYPDWTMIDGSGDIVCDSQTQEFDFSVQYGRIGNIPGPGTLIRNRSEFRESGIRNDHFHYFSDLEQWFRLALLGKIIRHPKFLASWRSHDSNQSSNTRSTQMCVETLALTRSFDSWHDERIRKYMHSAKMNSHLRVALFSLRFRPKLIHGGRLNLLAALKEGLTGRFAGDPIFRQYVTPLEAILILLNPIGRWALRFIEARRHREASLGVKTT